MKISKYLFSNILLLFGVFLMLASAALFIFWNINKQNALMDAKEVVKELREIMPETHDEIIDDRVNIALPEMEVNGKSYCGIIEVPAFQTELPIYADWDKRGVSKQPCLYDGSMYDGSAVIGGSDNEGQFDFMQSITNDDIVFITDMTGARYTYKVVKIDKTENASTDELISGEYDLTIFARNTYSLDYTVVRCIEG